MFGERGRIRTYVEACACGIKSPVPSAARSRVPSDGFSPPIMWFSFFQLTNFPLVLKSGVEPASDAYQAPALPLSYRRHEMKNIWAAPLIETPTRRGFLGGIAAAFAAPAIVRLDNIMPVKGD